MEAPDAVPVDPSVRVATWNILHKRENAQARTAEAARVLADCDVVLLQETATSSTYDSAADLADALGMTVAASAVTGNIASLGHTSGTAVLTRLPILKTEVLPIRIGRLREVAAAWLELPSGRTMIAVTAHLEWGSTGEPQRLAQAHAIDRAVTCWLADMNTSAESAPVVVFGGDFNARPESDTVRFLTGLGTSQGEGTLWVDAWDIRPGEPGYTTFPATNDLAAGTAVDVGLDASKIPPRRIDYLMVRGWAWGRAGCPLHVDIRGQKAGPGGVFASDHCAVVADLWDPPIGR